MKENWLVWKIWSIANSRDRALTDVGPGPVPSFAIMALCELYGATVEDFEKVLVLDRLMYKGPQSFMDDEKAFNDKVVNIKSKIKPKLKPKGKK